MGVKDLWTILAPICERKSLWEFEDKWIAIDLSCWVCDSQNIHDSHGQRNMYLRNLFFRTSHLLLQGILPVFILEGTAPELKHSTIEHRKNVRSKNATSSSNQRKGDRRRLLALQTQCAELLTSMGVPFIKSAGEAESLCAALNQAKLVAGAITQDSDCFLYGARTVFRNFSLSNTAGASVDVYDMDVIERKLKLGRNKLIALSLLLGCDYNENGVSGVGKELALQFLEDIKDCDILPRLQKWRTDTYLDMKENDKKFLSLNPSLKLEVKIRQKALKDPSFPSADVISEFLAQEQSVENLELHWKKPSLNKFLCIAIKKLCWEESYAIEKMLPVLSRWHLTHGVRTDSIIELEKIVKRRKIRGIASFEVMWKPFSVSTIEPENLVTNMYADLVSQFNELNSKKGSQKKQSSKRKKVLKEIPHNIVRSETNTQKKICQKASTKEDTKGVQTMDKFLVKLHELSLHDASDSKNNAEDVNNSNSFDFYSKGYETYYYEEVGCDAMETSASGLKCDSTKENSFDDNVDFSVQNTQTVQYPINTVESGCSSYNESDNICSSENYDSRSDYCSDDPKHAPHLQSDDNLALSAKYENDVYEKVTKNVVSNSVLPNTSTPLVSKSCNMNMSFDAEDPPSIKKTLLSRFSNKFACNESISVSDFECDADEILDLTDVINSIVNR